MKKINKRVGCLRIFFIIAIMAIGIPMLISAINKPTKGKTANESICEFIGVFDKTKDMESGVTGVIENGNGVFVVAYNFFPVVGENSKQICEEIGIFLTDDLKDLFKADERVKKIQINIKTPYTIDGETVYKPFMKIEIDSGVLNSIDSKSQLIFNSKVVK